MKRRFLLIVTVLFAAHAAQAEPSPTPVHNRATVNHAFRAGERLSYNVSWSGLLTAGTAAMEVKADRTPEGKEVFHLVSTARSAGIVTAFYPVADSILSITDAQELYSLSYVLDQKHGKKKKLRKLLFDQEKRTVKVVSNGLAETHEAPERVQDALSALYYLRTREDFTPGSSMSIDVFDGGKAWAVEVRTLGREKLQTVLGEVNTIKIATYPKYEGVFMHKGEIMMWLTDDERKVPVLMKSKISIGSIMATLTEMKGGDRQR